MAVERRITSTLLEQSSMEKIFEVDSHIGCAVSGLIADGRSLVDHARVEAQSHRFTYDEPMPVESLTQSVCDLAMSFGEGGEENKSKMSRPFGVSLLLAGIDARGPQLYHMDPSGTYTAYEAQAIGNGSEGARAMLQERFNKSLSLEQAASLVMRVLTETMEEKVNSSNIEVCKVIPGRGFVMLGKEELEGLMARSAAEAAAEGK